MNTYIHSVSLDPSKCTGCTTCMKHCPTEAIRVRNGCAVIDAERCIDCGECIRNCTNNAKKSICNSFDEIKNYKSSVIQKSGSSVWQLSLNFWRNSPQ